MPEHPVDPAAHRVFSARRFDVPDDCDLGSALSGKYPGEIRVSQNRIALRADGVGKVGSIGKLAGKQAIRCAVARFRRQ